MFVLSDDITIGGFRFAGVHEVRIKHSILGYMNTAVVKLPALHRMKWKNRTTEDNTLYVTAQRFRRGDKVVINLGYNNELNREFTGFVSRVNGGRPCEVECEGYSFQLRDKTLDKSYRKTTVKEVLKDIVAGTDIVLDKDIPDMELDKLNMALLNGQANDGIPMLDNLKKACGGILFLYFDGPVLYAGLGYTKITDRLKPLAPDVVYRMGVNAINDTLKQRIKGDRAVISFTSARKNDGSYLKARAGKGNAGVMRKRVQHIQNATDLKEVSTAQESIINYTGLEGQVTAFLQPFCKPGQKCKFADPLNEQRDSELIIDTVEVHYGPSGARRIPSLSHALS